MLFKVKTNLQLMYKMMNEIYSDISNNNNNNNTKNTTTITTNNNKCIHW